MSNVDGLLDIGFTVYADHGPDVTQLIRMCHLRAACFAHLPPSLIPIFLTKLINREVDFHWHHLSENAGTVDVGSLRIFVVVHCLF